MRFYLVILFLLCSGFSLQGDSAAVTVIQQRLNVIQNQIPLPHNKYVESYINLYQDRRPIQTARMIALGEIYFPMIEEVLTEYDLPLELKYMAVVESALIPNAVSPVGATGLWQFMYSAAIEYDLEIGTYVDERCDPELSTRAAARLLKKMYSVYGDWLMVIASYNCGPGNVNKAIRRSGNKDDFWEIHKYLPRETRAYVPAFIGATYVMEHAEVLGITPDYSDTEYLSYTPVMLTKELLVPDLIKHLDLDEAKVRLANASLTGDIIPANYNLKLPISELSSFFEIVDELYASAEANIDEYRARQKRKGFTYYIRKVPNDPNLEPLIYTVKEGDNLGFISGWYDAGLANLKAWNALRNDKILVGQELVVYVDKSLSARYSRFELLSKRQKNILSSDRNIRMLYARRFDDDFIYHEVKSGESFGLIQRNYEGVSIDDLRALNGIDDRELRVGMYIKIKENEAAI